MKEEVHGAAAEPQERLQRALERFEEVGRERSNAVEELLRAQAAFAYRETRGAPAPSCALDEAAAQLTYCREAFCAALWQNHCAGRQVQLTRMALRQAMERLDTLALEQTRSGCNK